jgi:hypothetical protein
MAYFGGIFSDGERKGLGLHSRAHVSGAGHFRLGWILEDEGVFLVFSGSFGAVLH